MRNRRWWLAALGVLAAGGGSAIATAPLATSARNPTQSERRALQRAVETFEGARVRIASARVSTVSPGWARVVEGNSGAANNDLLWQRRRGDWTVRNLVTVGAPTDGGCAFAPADVMHDLYKITCPPLRALHARRATAVEARLFTRVFRHDPRTRRVHAAPGLHLARVCVSRLNGRWAGTIAELPDTGIVAWFEKIVGRWRVARFGHGGTLPPRAIILSLASCVGYSAAEYGA